jgi:hypothetical protein
MATNADDERRLWQCVVIQALRDALLTRQCMRTGDELARHEARSWLESGGRDFELVCGMAGVEPTRLRTFWLEIKDHPSRFRSVRDAFQGVFSTKPGGHSHGTLQIAA